jgi:hypothetical protein
VVDLVPRARLEYREHARIENARQPMRGKGAHRHGEAAHHSGQEKPSVHDGWL